VGGTDARSLNAAPSTLTLPYKGEGSRRLRCAWWFALSRIWRVCKAPSIDVRIGPEVFQDFLTLFLMDHQVDARAKVSLFDAALGRLE
jgi:hypothetical protein